MRAIALLLVLSVAGPAVATAVCELRCAQARHHETRASTGGCHEHQSNAGTVALPAARDVACHRDAAIPTAIITAAVDTLPVLAAIQSLPPLSFNVPERSGHVARAGIGPHDLVPITTTPLRI